MQQRVAVAKAEAKKRLACVLICCLAFPALLLSVAEPAAPNRVLDNLGREAMAAVAEWSHADILPDAPLAPDPVSVTMPSQPHDVRASPRLTVQLP